MRGRDDISADLITNAFDDIEISVLTALRDSVFGDLTADGIRDNTAVQRKDMRLKALVEKGQVERIQSDGMVFYRIAPPGLERLKSLGQ